MKQINGLADCERMQTVNEKGRYKVTVTDGDGMVVLNIADATYPAGLTPDRARYVGRQLIAAARRVEQAKRPIPIAAAAKG